MRGKCCAVIDWRSGGLEHEKDVLDRETYTTFVWVYKGVNPIEFMETTQVSWFGESQIKLKFVCILLFSTIGNPIEIKHFWDNMHLVPRMIVPALLIQCWTEHGQSLH